MLHQSRKVAFDLRPQQGLRAVVGKLPFEFVRGRGRIAKQLPDRRGKSGLRSGALEQHAVEDLDLVKGVSFLLKELAPLLDGGAHHRAVVLGKRHLGPVRLAKILVDVEPRAKGFQSRFEALDRVRLRRMVQALVIDAGDVEHHAYIAALGQERRLVPKSVEAEVRIQRGRFFPGLDRAS